MSNYKSKYSEKLKDPRWQKKRLEVFERDGWKCQYCGDNKSTLHVHHFSYEKFKQPWEYSDDNFTTFCEFCHKAFTVLPVIEDKLGQALSDEDAHKFLKFISELFRKDNE